MKYGMNLLLWSGEVTDDVLQVCGKLKEIGYDGVELPIFNLDLDYSAIGSELDSLGLGRTGVTVRGEEDNPISPDAAVRAKGIELSKENIRLLRRRRGRDTGWTLSLRPGFIFRCWPNRR